MAENHRRFVFLHATNQASLSQGIINRRFKGCSRRPYQNSHFRKERRAEGDGQGTKGTKRTKVALDGRGQWARREGISNWGFQILGMGNQAFIGELIRC
jgi:hypothetical protein